MQASRKRKANLRAPFAAAVMAAVTLTGLVATTGPAAASQALCGDYGDTPSFNCVSSSGYTGQQPWGYPVDANGHNCTNYLSFRLSQNGASNPGNLGNAYEWDNRAASYGIPVDGTPAVGSAAVWEINHAPAMGSGHVAYVEAVTSSYIDISEDNYGGTTMRKRFFVGQADWPDHFVHVKDGAASPTPPTSNLTASTEDGQYGGDFNGDSYGDVAIAHRRTDGGADIHVLYGGVGTTVFSYPTTIARNLPASAGWDWTKMKFATGRFNSDGFADLAILHQRADGGADIHVLYGNIGASMFANSSTAVRNLPASDGWDWTKMKLTSGDVDGNGQDDLVVAHQLIDGGAGIHVFYGGVGAVMLSNTITSVRQLAGSNGWSWSQMKLAVGQFNGDSNADLVVIHRRGDGGINIHILNGGSAPFTNTDASSYLRSLLPADGWDWTKVKLAAGPFNSDGYADVALLHQLGDGGVGIHVLYGGSVPFSYFDIGVRTLAGTNGWNWSKIKLGAGLFNSDGYSDVAVVHETGDLGAGVHVLYGNPGAGMFTNASTSVRSLPASAGWNWSQMKLAQ